MTQINNFISLWFMMVSAALIALGSFACKYLIQIDGIYLTMLVSFVGGGILMWWVVSISSFSRVVPFAWSSIFIRVVFSLFAQLFFFISLSNGSLLITILLFNTSPLFIPVIRFLFYKQSVGYFNFACIIISFLGIYLILGVGEGNVNTYSLCALFAGVLNAASQVVLYNASKKEDVFIINLWIYTFIGMLLLPFNISAISSLNEVSMKPVVIWVSVAIIIFGISSQIFRVKAFKYTKDPSLIAPAMYFSVIVAALLDVVFYDSSIGYMEMIGILMVCVSSILSLIRK
ncbi:DMT family transporter [Francisella noatunensis]|uniref:DMT family transporter n=1 Tax=Francisella noatunensis TaxID=657445 RepID=A0A9Q2KSG2_9GAMM|nr:DMT family transporter [Francisella noatunensis]MBK2028838.1 DMT family transporter [Francisella noatunensis]MBK2033922.1 DMT family transporter [Francisella noatunensis]MBK2048393.1 DMT family transporter [Francisella noatunensis]MBK2050069.1 DMT family transporter [Francisella noatunensis]MBK2051371.1 DMT family transporter [Francisella noatunensis]